MKTKIVGAFGQRQFLIAVILGSLLCLSALNLGAEAPSSKVVTGSGNSPSMGSITCPDGTTEVLRTFDLNIFKGKGSMSGNLAVVGVPSFQSFSSFNTGTISENKFVASGSGGAFFCGESIQSVPSTVKGKCERGRTLSVHNWRHNGNPERKCRLL